MDAGLRVILHPQVRFTASESAVVKEDEGRGDAVARGDGQEAIHALQQAVRIVQPDEVLYEDAQAVVAGGGGPAQFLVDGFGVEACACHISVELTAVRGK